MIDGNSGSTESVAASAATCPSIVVTMSSNASPDKARPAASKHAAHEMAPRSVGLRPLT